MLKGLDKPRRDDRVLGVFGRAGGWRQPGAGPGRTGGDCRRAARSDHPDTNAGIELLAVRFGEQQVGRLGDQQPPLALVATAAVRPAHRVRQRGEPAAGPRRRPSREMAIRASVGATRWRIVRQLLVESLLLAFAAGALGSVALAARRRFHRGRVWPERSLLDAIHGGRTRAGGSRRRVFPVRALYSAWLRRSLASKTDVSGVMKEGGRTGIAPRTRRWTQALVAAELALTLILLAGAGLMVRSFLALYRADRLIDASQVLTVRVELPARSTQRRSSGRASINAWTSACVSFPALPLASVASHRPFVGAAARQLSIDGQPAASGEHAAIGLDHCDRSAILRDAGPSGATRT